jgi:hypothetical protein
MKEREGKSPRKWGEGVNLLRLKSKKDSRSLIAKESKTEGEGEGETDEFHSSMLLVILLLVITVSC